MLTKNFQQLQTKVSAHVAADRVKQGNYKTCFIGCLARKKDSPEFIESEYGIPLAVSRIAEAIFEGLPPDEAPAFFAAFPAAVESDGKDLSRVVWQFLAAELRLLSPVEPEVQAIINTVVTGIDLLAQGKEWPKEDAKASVRAADWAASAAANAAELAARAARTACAVADAANAAELAASDCDYLAAELAARAADWAAKAAASDAELTASDWDYLAAGWAARAAASSFDARRRQRDLLLKLIKEAPVTTTQE